MVPAVLKVCASVANYANYGLKELVAIGRFPRAAVQLLLSVAFWFWSVLILSDSSNSDFCHLCVFPPNSVPLSSPSLPFLYLSPLCLCI